MPGDSVYHFSTSIRQNKDEPYGYFLIHQSILSFRLFVPIPILGCKEVINNKLSYI